MKTLCKIFNIDIEEVKKFIQSKPTYTEYNNYMFNNLRLNPFGVDNSMKAKVFFQLVYKIEKGEI